MDSLYDFKPPVAAWDLIRSAQDAWDNGGPPLKKRRTADDAGGYASILEPLTKLVRESLDTVHNVSEALASLNVGGYAAGFSDEQIRLAEEQQEKLIQTERLNGARAHGQWVQAARMLDDLDGCDEWKKEEESTYYDHEDLRRRLEDLESAKDNEDLARMLRLIRRDLGRDVAGIGNPRLYEHSRLGTKDLIEKYITTAVDTIESAIQLSARTRNGSVAKKVRAHVVEARQSYGRTALLLSGGGTMGMMHIGVVKAMFEAGVLPRVISGASAGSIVAAVICTRTDAEVPSILEEFCNDLNVFTNGEEEARWSNMMYRLFTKGSLYDIKNLEDVMRKHVKDMTFLEAYNKTHRILSIAVSSENTKGEPLLLNYATTPHVLISSAVAASCSVPFIYRPAPLFERLPGKKKQQRFGGKDTFFIDGSVSHDIPLARLRAMLDVNHFVVSQVNPHIVPFLKMNRVGEDVNPAERTWMETVTELARTEVVHRLRQIGELPIPIVRKLTHMGSSILEQTYTGDITILPETSFSLAVLQNPTPEFMAEAMRKGERATWPELDRIERRTAVERAIDKSVASARERVVFSDSQVDLRLSHIRKQSISAKLRGRRSDSAGHRVTESMVLTGSDARGSYPPSITFARSRSSSEDGTHTSHSPSLRPDFTSSSPLPSDTEESEYEDEGHVRRHRPKRHLSSGLPNWETQSQPATPSIASKAFNFSPSPRPSSPVLTHAATFAMTPSSTNLASTTQPESPTPASKPPSSPERHYKRLFHGMKNLPLMRPAGSSSRSPEPSAGPGATDESRERMRTALLARKGKRSTSTGIRGLRPPGRQ